MIEEFFITAARVIEFLGVSVICAGIVISAYLFARQCTGGRTSRQALEAFRANLGRGILLGLELLVGADIIFTVTSTLTWESVGLLGLVVLIRTFLSFSLETEIEGVLPWRRREARGDEKQVR